MNETYLRFQKDKEKRSLSKKGELKAFVCDAEIQDQPRVDGKLNTMYISPTLTNTKWFSESIKQKTQ